MAASDSSRRVWAGKVTIAGVRLTVFRLPDGMRAIAAADVAALLQACANGVPVSSLEAEAAARFITNILPLLTRRAGCCCNCHAWGSMITPETVSRGGKAKTMQSSTPMSITDTGLQTCFVQIGKWAYAKTGRAQEVYSELYGLYLREDMTTTAPQRPARTPRPAREAAPAPQGTSSRVRTTPGTPGPKDAQVLAKIVASPEIAIDSLRRYFEAPTRQMTSNILGTAISRLLKGGYISGAPKVGPFTATATGVEAAKKVTSINTRRRASKATTGAAPAETTQPQAAAAG
jgi:hypothetical protein